MIKIDEKRRPDSCLNRACRDEMIFVLLARDRAAALAVRVWCVLRVILLKNRWSDGQIQSALLCAREMDKQRRAWREFIL